MSDRLKGIRKYFYDSEVLENVYCSNNNCHSCDGTDVSGEPNGYGCDAREDWVVEQIESENYEEITGDFDNLYVRLSDVEDLISEPKHETVEEWEARTGETYPDDGPVWVRVDGHFISLRIRSDIKDLPERAVITIANHHGKPQDIKGE